MQLVAPDSDTKPDAQGMHFPEPVAEKVPGEQGTKDEQAEIPLEQHELPIESRNTSAVVFESIAWLKVLEHNCWVHETAPIASGSTPGRSEYTSAQP